MWPNRPLPELCLVSHQERETSSSDFRIYAGRAELGTAWKAKTNSDEPQDYLCVQLDDPSFPEPIRAALFADEGVAFPVWN